MNLRDIALIEDVFINTKEPTEDNGQWVILALEMGDLFARENPLFDRSQFYAHIGLEPETL